MSEIKTRFEYNGILYDTVEEAQEQQRKDNADEKDIRYYFATFRFHVFKKEQKTDSIDEVTIIIPKCIENNRIVCVRYLRTFDSIKREYSVVCDLVSQTKEQFQVILISWDTLNNVNIKQERDKAVRHYIAEELEKTIIISLDRIKEGEE